MKILIWNSINAEDFETNLENEFDDMDEDKILKARTMNLHDALNEDEMAGTVVVERTRKKIIDWWRWIVNLK